MKLSAYKKYSVHEAYSLNLSNYDLLGPTQKSCLKYCQLVLTKLMMVYTYSTKSKLNICSNSFYKHRSKCGVVAKYNISISKLHGTIPHVIVFVIYVKNRSAVEKYYHLTNSRHSKCYANWMLYSSLLS